MSPRTPHTTPSSHTITASGPIGRWTWLLLLLSAIVVVAGACSTSTTTEPEAAVAPTATPADPVTGEPTAEPEAAPTADGTDSPAETAQTAGAAELDELAQLAEQFRPLDPNTLGVKFDWSKLDTDGDYLSSLGTRYSFYEISWCRLEPEEGEREYRILDRIVQRAIDIDYEIMIKIRVGSCWATGGPVGEARGERDRRPSTIPVDKAAYQAFVTELVTRYLDDPVVAYALENEVNGPNFWGGTVEEFVTVSEWGSEAVRAANPDAILLDSGLSSTAYGVTIANDLLEQGKPEEAVDAYNRYYLRRTRRGRDFPPIETETELREVLSAGQAARNLSYAEASADLAARGIVDRYQLHFYERYDGVADIMGYMNRAVDIPIEVTEAGIFWVEGDGDRDRLQAETALLATGLLANGADSVTFLPLRVLEDEIRWGLLDLDATPRKSGEIFRDLSLVLSGPNPRVTSVETGLGPTVIVGSDDGAIGIVNTGTPDQPSISVLQADTPEELLFELSNT